MRHISVITVIIGAKWKARHRKSHVKNGEGWEGEQGADSAAAKRKHKVK